jgi:hypothetical protein
MPEEGRGFDEPPLFGPTGRIPRAQAVTLTRQPGIAALRKGWLPRHTVAMIVLSPLLFLAYNAALGRGFHDPLWGWLTGAMSLVAALTLTTYLPLRGTRLEPGSSCAVMAGLLVPGAAILLNQATGTFSGALALGILGLGLWQRLSGTSACG